jgi:hypothetical protein
MQTAAAKIEHERILLKSVGVPDFIIMAYAGSSQREWKFCRHISAGEYFKHDAAHWESAARRYWPSALIVLIVKVAVNGHA